MNKRDSAIGHLDHWSLLERYNPGYGPGTGHDCPEDAFFEARAALLAELQTLLTRFQQYTFQEFKNNAEAYELRNQYRDAAQAYCDDDLQIDLNAPVSLPHPDDSEDTGAFVQAWLYVPKCDLED